MSPPPWAQSLRNPIALAFGPELAQAANLLATEGFTPRRGTFEPHMREWIPNLLRMT